MEQGAQLELPRGTIWSELQKQVPCVQRELEIAFKKL